MLLQVVITVLCGVGLYTTLFMLGKTRRAERGLLEEPSVVKLPAARLYWGLPNALLGAVYYPALAIAVWFGRGHVVSLIVLTIVAFAAVTSAFLAYSLLFMSRRECPYCWTAHVTNWALLVMILLIQKEHIV
jgi:uncharacterized membrane protein